MRGRSLGAALVALLVVGACSDPDTRPDVDSLMVTAADLPGDLTIQDRPNEPGVQACAGVLELGSTHPGEAHRAADILGSHAFFVEVYRHADDDAARAAFQAAGAIADSCDGGSAAEPDGTTSRFAIAPVDRSLLLPTGAEADARHHTITNAFVVELDVITVRVGAVVAVAGGTDPTTTASLVELMAARAAGLAEPAVVRPEGVYQAVPADHLDNQLGSADPPTLFRLAATGIPRLTPESASWVARATDVEIENLGNLACRVVETAGPEPDAQDAALLEAWEQLSVDERGRLDPGSFGQLAATALVVFCPETAVDLGLTD